MFTAAPSATFLETFIRGSGHERTFALQYSAKMDAATLGKDDVLVTGPNGFSARATFVGTVPSNYVTNTIARYRIRGIEGGAFTVSTIAGGAADLNGAGVQARELGGFRVGAKGHTVPRLTLAAHIGMIQTTYGTIANPPLIDATTYNGNVLMAVNIGGPAVDVVGSNNKTIHFSSGIPTTSFTNSAQIGTGPFTVQVDAASNNLDLATIGGDAVYHTEIYTMTWADESVTISGLDPTQSYRLQFLHGDSRLGAVPYASTPQTFIVNGAVFDSTPLHFNTSAQDGSANVIVDITGAQTFSYVMPAAVGRGPSFSGLVISAAPATAPRATLHADSIHGTGSSRTFMVEYDFLAGIDASTIGDQNLMVTGPNGYSASAHVLSIAGRRHGQSRRVIYEIDGIESAGKYEFSIGSAPVADMYGQTIAPHRIGGTKILAHGKNWPFNG